MNRELAAVLKDLGLTPTEAMVYVALLEHASQEPLSAYKLAQILGRDPANMTKTLGVMVRRGAVTSSGRRPIRYAPETPHDFTGSIVSRVQVRQQRAVEMLEKLGAPADDGRARVLESRAQALACARRLLATAERIVLVDAAPEVLAELENELAHAAEKQGAVVLSQSSPGAPGPWLRLVVDGAVCLGMVARPDNDELLHGSWSRNPAQAYLTHRELGAAILLAEIQDLLHAGTGADAVQRHAEERTALVLHQIPWQHRWSEAGWPRYAPTAPANGFRPELPGQVTTEAEGAEDAEGADDTGPLKFVFRRTKTD